MLSVKEKAEYWATSAVFDAATRAEVAQILADEKELRERFSSELEFGTGGLRGIVGAGSSRMNIYNIRKASLALGQCLQKKFPQGAISVAVSYDSRLHSPEFAAATCEVLAALGIRSLLSKELRPVPVLAFMVRHFKCRAGVCITASHNPPDYNGYKVYWEHGGQVVPPHDTDIIAAFAKISGYENLPRIPYTEALQDGVITEVGAEIDDIFIDTLPLLARGNDSDIKAVYSPLHGAGMVPVTKSLQRFGYEKVQVVAAQREADGRFPTVSSPNPEDPQALQLATELAKATDAELVLATDPDCDRLGVMVKDGDIYRRIDGNQLICLLMEYVLATAQAKGELTGHDLVVKTIVTTDMVDAIAAHYGVHCEATLTGFKWIGQLIEDYETNKITPYRRFLYGGEESFGLLYGRHIRDKDGIVACCLAMKATAHFKSQGKTWFDVLDDLYVQHGVYHHELLTFSLPGLEGKERITELMAVLRTDPACIGTGTPERLIDYASGEIKENRGGKLEVDGTVSLPKSDVLQLVFTDGIKISARPSGTEPKIKYYIAVKKDVPSAAVLPDVKKECVAKADEIKQKILSL